MATAKRKSISKSIRYDVFARDGYTCQYCGAKPPDVLLVVDHRVPVSRGGGNDLMNLIAACQPCNQGKSAKLPGAFTPTPDADLQTLKMCQEQAEYELYLVSKADRDFMRKQTVKALQDHWDLCSGYQGYVPSEKILLGWLSRFGPDCIERGISIGFATGKLYSSDHRSVGLAVRYISGIMYRIAEEEANA